MKADTFRNTSMDDETKARALRPKENLFFDIARDISTNDFRFRRKGCDVIAKPGSLAITSKDGESINRSLGPKRILF